MPVAVPIMLVIAVVVFRPLAGLALLGIAGPVWCLFACAPITSLCLFLGHRQSGTTPPQTP